jgi:hypothetical protein
MNVHADAGEAPDPFRTWTRRSEPKSPPIQLPGMDPTRGALALPN